MRLEVKKDGEGKWRKFNLDSSALSGDLTSDGPKLYPNHVFRMQKGCEGGIAFTTRGASRMRVNFKDMHGNLTGFAVGDRAHLFYGEAEVCGLRIRIHP